MSKDSDLLPTPIFSHGDWPYPLPDLAHLGLGPEVRAIRAGSIGRDISLAGGKISSSAAGGGGFLPASSTEKSLPYDAKRIVLASGPSQAAKKPGVGKTLIPKAGERF